MLHVNLYVKHVFGLKNKQKNLRKSWISYVCNYQYKNYKNSKTEIISRTDGDEGNARIIAARPLITQIKFF